MKKSNEFNVSNNNPELQKSREYEQHQREIEDKRITQNIRDIQDSKDLRHAETLLNHRDHLMQTRRDMQEEYIGNEQAREIERDRLEKPTFEMPSPYGVDAKNQQTHQREDYIRTQVRQNMELKYEPENREIEKEANRKIEEFVQLTLKNERENAQELENAPELSFKEKLRQGGKDNEPSFERKEEPDRKP